MVDGDGRVRVAQTRDVLAGGLHGTQDIRRQAAEAEAAWPGMRALACRVSAFHRWAALWAVTETRTCPSAHAVVFTSAGFPPPGRPLHANAAVLAPAATFCYVHGTRRLALTARAVLELADPGRVLVTELDRPEPESWLESDAGQALLAAGPVSVHMVAVLHRWSPQECARVLLAYRRGLPSGSSVCLSAATARGPEAERWAEYISELTGPVRLVSPGQMAGRIAFAGLRLHPRGVRVQPPDGPGAPVPRLLEAVAIVPLRRGREDTQVPRAVVTDGGVVLAAVVPAGRVDGPDGDLGGGEVTERAREVRDPLGEQREGDGVRAREPAGDAVEHDGGPPPQVPEAGPVRCGPGYVGQCCPGPGDRLHACRLPSGNGGAAHDRGHPLTPCAVRGDVGLA